MPIAHLNRLEEAAMLMLILEYIGLQVSIDHEDGDASDVLEGLLVSFDNLLHGFKGHLRAQHLLHILIYHLNFLDVDLGRSVPTTKSTD